MVVVELRWRKNKRLFVPHQIKTHCGGDSVSYCCCHYTERLKVVPLDFAFCYLYSPPVFPHLLILRFLILKIEFETGWTHTKTLSFTPFYGFANSSQPLFRHSPFFVSVHELFSSLKDRFFSPTCFFLRSRFTSVISTQAFSSQVSLGLISERRRDGWFDDD